MSDIKSIAGRACSPAPIAISLHKFVGSLAQLEGLISNCRNKSRPSYNYGIEGCKITEFVPAEDTAYAIPYPVCPVPVPPTCPTPLPECWDGTTVIDALPSTVNPNCKVISIALVVGINTTDLCSDSVYAYSEESIKCLAELIKTLSLEYPDILIDPANIFVHGNELPDFPICDLIDCINAIVPTDPVPNPDAVVLCNALSEFETGVPVTVFGKDADGNCVQGAVAGVTTTNVLALAGTILSSTVNGVPATVDLATLLTPAPVYGMNINTATPAMEFTVDGAVVSTLPLVALNEALTGVQLGWIFPV